MNRMLLSIIRVSSLFLIALFSFQLAVSQPTKRVLLEQHTGAWCGYCVDGTVIMDQILELYPDKVIGVKVHNGDKMVIPEQGTIATTLGLTGYPAATIDRFPYQGASFIMRNLWQAAVESYMQQTPFFDIQTVYSLDPKTRILNATVTAIAAFDISGEVRLNLWVVEDSCSGSGSGWDQSNYYDAQPGHPFFGLGNPVKNYQHEKVVRKMLGGAWGAAGSVTEPIKSGNVYNFNFVDTLDATWKLKDLWFIGLVQANTASNKRVYNVVKGIPGTPKTPSIKVSLSGGNFAWVSSAKAWNKAITLTNTSTTDLVYTLGLAKSARTPGDWTVTSNPADEISIPAGKSADVTISINPTSTLGFCDASLTVKVKNDAAAIGGFASLNCISSEIQGLQVIDNTSNKAYSLTPILNTLGYKQFIEISPDEFNKYGTSFPNLKYAIFNAGPSTGLAQADVSTISSLLGNNVNTLVCGGAVGGYLQNYGGMSLFGAQYVGWNVEGYGSSPWRIYLSGIAGDPITGDFGTNKEGNLINVLLPTYKILDTQGAKSILHFTNSGRYVNATKTTDTVSVTPEEAIVGLRYQSDTYKAVLLGLSPYVIVNSTLRNNLVKNSIDWLMSPLGVEDDSNTAKNDEFVLSVSPNPFQSNMNIVYTNNTKDNYPVELKLVDVKGDQIWQTIVEENGPGPHNYPFDASSLPQGSFTLVLKANGKLLSIPVVKIR